MEKLDYNEHDYKLRILEPKDVTLGYVKWISDPEINIYSQNRYRTFTFESQVDYVENMFNSSDNHLYGIFHNELHIGNILLGPIDWINNICDLRVVIGYKKYWGKQIFFNCCQQAFKKSFSNHSFFKICATIYSKNLYSIFAAKKLGFVKEGIRKYHRVFNDERVDLFEYSLFLRYGKIISEYSHENCIS